MADHFLLTADNVAELRREIRELKNRKISKSYKKPPNIKYMKVIAELKKLPQRICINLKKYYRVAVWVRIKRSCRIPEYRYPGTAVLLQITFLDNR